MPSSKASTLVKKSGFEHEGAELAMPMLEELNMAHSWSHKYDSTDENGKSIDKPIEYGPDEEPAVVPFVLS